MTRSETLGVVASGSLGPAILALYLLRVLTADLAFAIIGFSFSVALVPGIVENHRKRIGWSKRSCIMTGNNLFAFTVIFLTLGLVLTAVSEFVSGAMWTVLLVQAFVYAKPRQVVKATMITDDCGYCSIEPEARP